MKKLTLLCVALLAFTCSSFAQAQEYKIVTVIESIVPMGLGRSRMIENKTEKETANYTTERTDGKKSNQGDIKRKDLKVDEFSEAKLLNFFSATGINFQNIASNDAMIGARMNELSEQGWKLSYVTSGVESNAGKDDGEGLFITRMVFSRPAVATAESGK